MKVKDLRAQLNSLDDELEVVVLDGKHSVAKIVTGVEEGIFNPVYMDWQPFDTDGQNPNSVLLEHS